MATSKSKLERKVYALHRMAIAIDRAIVAPTSEGKNRAVKWVAAWRLVGAPSPSERDDMRVLC
jgi:hypothetical protein